MGRRLIEVMQVFVDQIHQDGYQHRVLEDSIREEKQKRVAAEKDRDHWKAARQDAIAAGELMQAEIERLNAFVGKVRGVMSSEYNGVEFDDLSRALDELDAGTSSVVKDSLTPAEQQ